MMGRPWTAEQNEFQLAVGKLEEMVLFLDRSVTISSVGHQDVDSEESDGVPLIMGT